MLHKFIDSIRHINRHTSGFDAYLANIQRSGLSDVPTLSEAKKDYRNAISHTNPYILG